ncbi:sulfurtransferase TusA family protein [Cutibacterium modestum]|uniref:sulfurtransferase TusA family protein n=1 Tax=Cutibacterium modestum TaxID=2559073 RepID=UPI001F44C183|nr:sulfurtransferase TusA family protein [Cutibacterium modestum]MCP2378439.1 redox protein, regulator of disulfide bond formation [Cutibacterium modestum 31N]
MATHVLEAGGHVWPFPLIEIQKVISGLPGGDRLTINFDCTQVTGSISELAAVAGYAVIDFRKVGGADQTITVEKV